MMVGRDNGWRVKLPYLLSGRVSEGGGGDGGLAVLAAFGLGGLGLSLEVVSTSGCCCHQM